MIHKIPSYFLESYEIKISFVFIWICHQLTPIADRLTLSTTKKYVKDKITEAVKDLADVKKLHMKDDTDKTARGMSTYHEWTTNLL